jgi:O-antigen biosynthesis protein
MTSNATFTQIMSQEGWTIAQVAECLKQLAASDNLDDEAVCLTLLAWVNATPHVADHATGRRFTRLQFIENTFSAAGFALTQRDFNAWFVSQSYESHGNWRPDELLPYATIDLRLEQQEARIDKLEHDLHQMEVARNRAKAELAHVQAERDHFIATNSEQIYKSVSADYQNSASWRVTRPLRQLTAWRRGERFVEPRLMAKPVPAIAPWAKPGYSVEKAWRDEVVENFDRKDYVEWVRRFDTPSDAGMASLNVQAVALAQLPHAPTFSLLMAVEQPDVRWLKEAIASVQAQIYPSWELCIAISSSADAVTCEALDAAAKVDRRISLIHGVSAKEGLLAKAFESATGGWVAALSAINKIAAQAVNTTAKAIFEGLNAQMIYSDSDKLLAPEFQRAQPNFKPDWNVDLFLSSGSLQNYTQDVCFFNSDLVRECGGFDAQYTDAAVFDLTLRAIERLEPSQICHIPQVLVHVREGVSQTENSRAEQIQALSSHFERTGQPAKVLTANIGFQIQYALPEKLPLVSVIIPTKNNAALLRQCIDSMSSKTSYPNYEILVVDNGSDQPETLDYLKTLTTNPKIRVIRDNYAFNYSALNNYAATFAKGEVLALVNDDIEVGDVASADWLTEMISHALRPGIGAVGARLWYPDQTLQHAGMVLVGGVARHIHKHLPKGEAGFNGRAVLTQNFSAVTGACLVVQKALFEQVGGLNDQELAVGFNDVDFCLKLGEAGYRNVWTPYAELIHHESATRGQDHSPEKQRRAEKELRYMRKRWGDKLHVDPAYSPNLSDGRDDMSFAWPPRSHKPS